MTVEEMLARRGLTSSNNGAGASPRPMENAISISDTKVNEPKEKKNLWETITGFIKTGRDAHVKALEDTADYYAGEGSGPNVLGYMGEKTAVGAVDRAEGVANAGSYWLQLAQKSAQQQAAGGAALAAAFSKDKEVDALAQRRQQDAAKSLDTSLNTYFNFGDKYTQKVEDKYADADIGKVGRFAGDVAQGLGGLAVDSGVNALAPGLGEVTMLSSSIGNGMQQALKEGADNNTALAYGLATGAVEYITEKIFGGMGQFIGKSKGIAKALGNTDEIVGVYGKGLVDDWVKQLITKNVSNGYVRTALNTLLSGLGEGAEELIAEWGNHFANELFLGTDERTTGEIWTDAGRNALVGGIIGSLANMGDSVRLGGPVDPAAEGKKAAGEVKQQINNAPTQEAEISPSDGVEAQPSADTTESGNAGTVNQGMPGFEGVGVGAAAAGEMNTPFSEWRENSTAPEHATGEKAARYLGAPTIDEQGRHTQKTGQTIAEAAITIDERAAQIESLYVNGDLSYIPVVDTTLAQGAAEAIERDGWTTSVREWRKAVHEGRVSPELVATGAQLLNNAGQEGNASAADYADLVVDYSNLLHSAGQSLQAARILKMLTPEGRLYGIQKSVQKMAKEVGDRYGVEIPANLVNEYRTAKTDAERNDVVSKMQKAVAKRLPSTIMDKWTALRYVNMLGNFKTQERNVFSNLGNLAMYRIKDAVGAAIENIANIIKPGSVERTKSAAVSIAWRKAAWNDFKSIQTIALGEGKYNDNTATDAFGRGVDRYRSVFKNNGDWGTKGNSPRIVKLSRKVTDALWKVPEAYRIVTNFAIEAGDLIFSRSTYSHALAGFLKARGVTPEQFESGAVSQELLDDARVYAIKQAQEVTLRDHNAFSDAISKTFRGEKMPKWLKVVGEGALPFRRTPANAMVRMYEYSPVSLLTAAHDVVKAKRANTAIKGSDIVEQLSKAITGTGLMILGAVLRDHGLLRASGNGDDEDTDALMNEQDWSLVIPGVGSYTMDWASSAMLPLFMGAQLNELLDDKQIGVGELIQAVESMPEPILEMSMLSGLNDAIEAAQYSEHPLFAMLMGFALNYYTQGLTNSLIGQMERASEESRMSTYVDPNSPLPEWFQRTLGKMSAKTPGWDYQQTEYLNEFGEHEKSGVGERILENFFSPGYFEAEKSGETAYDFAEWANDELGVKAYPDAYPPYSVSYNNQDYELNQSQRNTYQEIRGNTAQELIEWLDRKREFDRITKEEQRKVISQVMSFAENEAKIEALKDNGVRVESSAKDKVIDKMTPSQYIDWLITDVSTDIPANYKDHPTWSQFEKALVLPDSLAISMMIAQNESAGKRIDKAVKQGVPLDKAVAYYKAINQRTMMGAEPDKDAKESRINKLGLSEKQEEILAEIFK